MKRLFLALPVAAVLIGQLIALALPVSSGPPVPTLTPVVVPDTTPLKSTGDFVTAAEDNVRFAKSGMRGTISTALTGANNLTVTDHLGSVVLVDTTNSAFTLTLPDMTTGSAEYLNGGQMTFFDQNGTWHTNNLTIARGGSTDTIEGSNTLVSNGIHGRLLTLTYRAESDEWYVAQQGSGITEITAVPSRYADVANPTNAELINDIRLQGAPANSPVRLGYLYRANASGSPSVIDRRLVPTGTPAYDTDIFQGVVDEHTGSETLVIDCTGTWTLDESILVDSAAKIKVNGGVFSRIDETTATTTQAITAADGSFTVTVDAVPANWSVGSRAVVRDPGVATVNGIGPNSDANVGLSFSGSNDLNISGISGTTLTISNGCNKSFASGVEIVQTFNLFRIRGEAIFCDCYFEGNNDGYFIETWMSNLALAADPNFDGARVRAYRCKFINSPSESTFLTRGSALIDCDFIDCDGSAGHITTQPSPSDGIKEGEGVWIERCFTYDCNLASQSLDHSEGVITFSVRSTFVTVKDCHFRNSTRRTLTDVGACDVVAPFSFSDDDSFLRFENNTCSNFEYIFQWGAGQSSLSEEDKVYGIHFTDNTFVGCGDILSTATTNAVGASSGEPSDIRIENNKFWGSRIHLKAAIGVDIKGNKFYFQGYNSGYFANSLADDATAAECVIHIHGDHINIEDNFFHAHVASGKPVMSEQIDGTDIAYCIRFESSNASDQLKRKQHVRIKNNQIWGFNWSIVAGSNIISSVSSDYLKNVIIEDNLIVYENNSNLNGASVGVGIVTKPGCITRSNQIIGLDQISRGIQINAATATYNDRWQFILDNIIRLAVSPANTSMGNTSSSSHEAMCIQGNITSTSISLNGSATNRESANNVVTTLEPDLVTDWTWHTFAAPDPFQ